MSCDVLGVGAPNTHWSKKMMRPTPSVDASRASASCVDMTRCSPLPSMAKRESEPRDTGDSNTNWRPVSNAVVAMRAQLATIALARMTVAGNP
eukprot:2350054-Pleurochrysis_carterae.AAC.1